MFVVTLIYLVILLMNTSVRNIRRLLRESEDEETPQKVVFFRGGSARARGKRSIFLKRLLLNNTNSSHNLISQNKIKTLFNKKSEEGFKYNERAITKVTRRRNSNH